MKFKYIEVLNARDEKWLYKAKAHLDKGEQFAVAYLEANQIRDCKAYAQEHDYTCIVEDRLVTAENFPDNQPEIIGFVSRFPEKRISD